MSKFPLGQSDGDRVAFDEGSQIWQRTSGSGGAGDIKFSADTVQDLEALTSVEGVVVGSIGLVLATGNLYRATAATVASSSWEPASGAWDVRDFGAVGDGVTEDSVNCQTALDTAPENAVIVFPSGFTFVLVAALNPQAGQQLWGYGAILQTQDQVATTTSTALVSGVTNVIEVASVAGLSVGMDIVVENGGTYDQSSRRISDITGTTLTLTTAVGITAAAGSNVRSAFYLMLSNLDGIGIYGFNLDGNRANNAWGRWENTGGIRMGGDDLRIRDVNSDQSAGEGFTVGGASMEIRDCHATNLSGNGFHLSGTSNFRVIGCFVFNCNLDVTVGHADGGIILSDDVTFGHFLGCEVDTTPLAAYGSIDQNDNTDLLYEGCIGRNATANAVEATCPLDTASKRISFKNCQFYSCGPFLVQQTNNVSTDFPTSWSIEDCDFHDTIIRFDRATDAHVRGNLVDSEGDAASILVLFNGCKESDIADNRTVGGERGIYLATTGTHNCEDCTVRDNRVRDFATRGIIVEAGSTLRINVFDNTVQSAAANAVIGIQCRDRNVCRGNYVEVPVANAVGIETADDMVCQSNTVRMGGAAGALSIRAFGGTSGYFIVNNQVNPAVTNGGTGTARDNDLIAV